MESNLGDTKQNADLNILFSSDESIGSHNLQKQNYCACEVCAKSSNKRSIDQRNLEYSIKLEKAICQGNETLAKELIQKKPKYQTCQLFSKNCQLTFNNQKTFRYIFEDPFYEAVQHARVHLVELLIPEARNIMVLKNARYTERNESILHVAVNSNCVKTVLLVLRLNIINVNATNKYGSTPLANASANR